MLNKPANHNRSRGFTLIEMLVALAVVAISLAAISQHVIQSLDVTIGLRERTLARWVAANLLAEQQLTDPWPDITTREGQLSYAGEQWQWNEVVRASADADFRHIEFTVRPKGANSDSASLVGYARNPNPKKAGTGP